GGAGQKALDAPGSGKVQVAMEATVVRHRTPECAEDAPSRFGEGWLLPSEICEVAAEYRERRGKRSGVTHRGKRSPRRGGDAEFAYRAAKRVAWRRSRRLSLPPDPSYSPSPVPAPPGDRSLTPR